MQYCCTTVSPQSPTATPRETADQVSQHLSAIARQGWRLVSTSSQGGSTAVYLYWEKQ
jgi:hypothetical protein